MKTPNLKTKFIVGDVILFRGQKLVITDIAGRCSVSLQNDEWIFHINPTHFYYVFEEPIDIFSQLSTCNIVTIDTEAIKVIK